MVSKGDQLPCWNYGNENVNMEIHLLSLAAPDVNNMKRSGVAIDTVTFFHLM